MSRPDFRYFAIFGTMRTGSNLLERLINQYDGLACHGEMFNPFFIGSAEQTSFEGFDIAARERDPMGLIERAIATSDGKLPGFRIFQGHDVRVERHALADPDCAKIILRRNPIDSFVSLCIARKTDQWILGNATSRKSAKVTFEAELYQAYVAELTQYYDNIRAALQAAGQTAFEIRYEDLKSPPAMNGLAAFLGRAQDLQRFNEPIKRQNPEPLSEKVENYSEMMAALGGMQTTAIAAATPAGNAKAKDIVVSQDNPLLYAPVPGTARNPVMTWLRDFNAGLDRNLNQSELQSWLDRAQGLTAMTLVEHPLARAYRVFQKRIFSNGDQTYEMIQSRLVEHYGLVLPEGEASEAETVAGFTVFLNFVKSNLARQTSLRVDAEWDYQSAYLESVAKILPLTHIVRDRDFPAMSRVIARSFDADIDRGGMASHGGGRPLSKIYSPELEKLCRAAYQRDYRRLGYGDWAALD